MSQTPTEAFLELVSARRGHFKLESGHHGALWLELDTLFAEPKRVMPFVERLANAIRPQNVAMVCGPVVGGAFVAQLVAQMLDAELSFTERVAPASPDELYQTRYVLPPTLAAKVRGKRVAIVDDVMSAGSSLRATFHELRRHGATPVIAGALLILGTTGAEYLASNDLPIAAAVREPYDLWRPADCPLCRAGVPLEDPSARSA